MGAVQFTGLTPEIVSKLTLWQVQNDFIGLANEIHAAMNSKGEAESLEEEDRCPTLREHVQFMQGQRPEMTLDEIKVHYERFVADNYPDEVKGD